MISVALYFLAAFLTTIFGFRLERYAHTKSREDSMIALKALIAFILCFILATLKMFV